MGLLFLYFTQNNRNNSDFHLCMAVLGLALRLPATIFILEYVRGKEVYQYLEDDIKVDI
jgi:hypothetical protein